MRLSSVLLAIGAVGALVGVQLFLLHAFSYPLVLGLAALFVISGFAFRAGEDRRP